MKKNIFVLGTIINLTILTVLPHFAKASIPSAQKGLTLEAVLAEKGPDKIAKLRLLGPHVYQDLRKITFTSDRALNTRWSAFMAMAHLGDHDALPEINLALRSSDWFLRDAALRVLPNIDRDLAYNSAVAKLGDSALVVRTTAVDILGELNDPRCSQKLWSQLYSKDNYIRHQSLWIRRHIVEALSRLAEPGSEDKFMKVLDDADSTLFAPAIKGLERLTNKKLGDENVPPVYRRYYWKKWYKESLRKS